MPEASKIAHRYLRLLGLLLSLAFISACGGPATQKPAGTGKAITGTVSISGMVMMDGDTNDTNASYNSNDSIATAQTIPNPAMVSGYVNQPGSGSQGRSSEQGDITDFFKTTLVAGQTVRLLIGNPGDITATTNDLELTLQNTQGDTFDSTGTESSKSVNVSATGEYYIRVGALSGASNYLLIVSLDAFSTAEQTNVQADDEKLNVDQAFVPGEIIVKFKDAGSNVMFSPKGDELRKKAGGRGRNSLYKITSVHPINITASRNNTVGNDEVDKYKRELKQKTLDVLKALRQRQDVESARLNYLRHATAIPNDPYYLYQWNYAQINLPQAWDVTTGTALDGEAVIVAVIDTGILPDHPDLQGQLVAGYDFIQDSDNAGDGDGIDDNPFDEGDGGLTPSSFHGTHVAGIAAAASNNSVGVAGVAWGAKVMPLRVLGPAGGTDYDIEQAIRYAAGLENDSGQVPPQRADVINLSLGGQTNITTPPEAYTLAREAGVIIVAAAGNEGSDQLSYPASLDGVVSVSAVGFNKNITDYSNYGSTIDLAAPGGNLAEDLNSDGYADGVLSTLALDEGSLEYLYAFYQGTSMAAPHVTGVVALMKSVYRDMTPQQFDQWLTSGILTEDLGPPGRDNYYGHGLIDAYNAVSVANNAAGGALAEPDPQISTDNLVLNFSYDKTTLNFVLENSGAGSLTVESINVESQNWLDIAPVSVDTSGLGTYEATINRDVLPDNSLVVAANITIGSTAGTLTIPVLVLSSDLSRQVDAGIHYIQLIDTESGQAIKQVHSAADNGQYTFTMDNIPFGTYILIAGSNPDNNGFICDAAEACGEYPSAGHIEQITIDESSPTISTLDFATSINTISISQKRILEYMP